MDVSNMIRKPEVILKALKEMPDQRVVALAPCKIYIPTRYTDVFLAEVSSVVNILGIFGITVEDKYYGVSNALALMTIKPSDVNIVEIGDATYFEFIFHEGDTVIVNRNLVKTATLAYRVFDEIVDKGKTPWYLGYDDLGKLFDTAIHHAGANLATNHAILEMINSSRARLPKDRSIYYRQAIKTEEQRNAVEPVMIPLKSIQYGATNTSAKLMGAYFDEGLNSALVNPSERSEKIEELLRK